MPIELRPAYVCAECGHPWLVTKDKQLPTHCPKCRSRKWNGEKVRDREETERRRDYISEEW